MSEPSPPRHRTAANAQARPPVRLSVTVDVLTHARLCALAALRGVNRDTLAAAMIREGTRGVIVRDTTTGAGGDEAA